MINRKKEEKTKLMITRATGIPPEQQRLIRRALGNMPEEISSECAPDYFAGGAKIHMNVVEAGGGNRARNIVTTAADAVVMYGDHEIVRACFMYQAPSIKQWIAWLSMGSLLQFISITKSYARSPLLIPLQAGRLIAEVAAAEDN